MLAITEDLLGVRPGGNRPGVSIAPQLIIIHRTGNPGSTAKQNRDYFDTETNRQVYASAHYCVDSHQIIRCVPETEKAYHCIGQNHCSIGIELCEPLTPEAYENFKELIIDILLRHGWSWTSDYVRPHSAFDPKNRPFDPFSWMNFRADRPSPRDLFEPRKFYSELAEMLRLRGGRA